MGRLVQRPSSVGARYYVWPPDASSALSCSWATSMNSRTEGVLPIGKTVFLN